MMSCINTDIVSKTKEKQFIDKNNDLLSQFIIEYIITMFLKKKNSFGSRM
jgi:hypothetical protein